MNPQTPVMLTLCLVVASGCASATSKPSAAERATASPDEIVAYLGQSEVDVVDTPGIEAEIGREIDRSLARWPEDWRFRAFRASHLVRVEDRTSARVEHENARRLYELNPYWIDPAVGEGVAASPAQGAATRSAGSPIGVLVSAGILGIVDSATEDVVIAYPAEPGAKTWLPPRDAYTKTGERDSGG